MKGPGPREFTIYRARVRGRDHGRLCPPGSPGRDRGPNDGHVRLGPYLLSNSPQSTARHRGAALPNRLPRTEVVSSNLHAICSDGLPGTNSPRPIRTLAPGPEVARRKPLVAAVVPQ